MPRKAAPNQGTCCLDGLQNCLSNVPLEPRTWNLERGIWNLENWIWPFSIFWLRCHGHPNRKDGC